MHGNITPLMCALCLTEGEEAAHAYIMVGGTILRFLFFFSFDCAIHLPAGAK